MIDDKQKIKSRALYYRFGAIRIQSHMRRFFPTKWKDYEALCCHEIKDALADAMNFGRGQGYRAAQKGIKL